MFQFLGIYCCFHYIKSVPVNVLYVNSSFAFDNYSPYWSAQGEYCSIKVSFFKELSCLKGISGYV